MEQKSFLNAHLFNGNLSIFTYLLIYFIFLKEDSIYQYILHNDYIKYRGFMSCYYKPVKQNKQMNKYRKQLWMLHI